MKKIGSWKKLSSRFIYKNHWIRIREDKVIKPDGSKGVYGILEAVHNSVFIVALDSRGRVMLQKQFRYTTRERNWEIPAGWLEKGESPLQGAKRELLEETGLVAKKWKLVGSAFVLDGLSDAKMNFTLAMGLSKAPGEKLREEGIVEHKFVPLSEIKNWINSGKIKDGQSLAALLAALGKLNLIK